MGRRGRVEVEREEVAGRRKDMLDGGGCVF